MPNAEEVKRCLYSKNPCGTDTWQAGKPCPCENCQEWIDSTLLERTGKLNDLRRKLDESERVKNDTIKLRLGDQAQWQKGLDSYKAELDASRAENERLRAAIEKAINEVYLSRDTEIEFRDLLTQPASDERKG